MSCRSSISLTSSGNLKCASANCVFPMWEAPWITTAFDRLTGGTLKSLSEYGLGSHSPMRISSERGDAGATLSGADSAWHWFNPPRDGTDDAPLEIEFYFLLDGSAFSADIDALTDQMWGALWAFSHGEGDFGWPSGGEMDLLEWLPKFDARAGGLGATTGFYNVVTGAYPPCCMKADPVMYPYGLQGSAVVGGDGFLLPHDSKFSTWGEAMQRLAGRPQATMARVDRRLSCLLSLWYNHQQHQTPRVDPAPPAGAATMAWQTA